MARWKMFFWITYVFSNNWISRELTFPRSFGLSLADNERQKNCETGNYTVQTLLKCWYSLMYAHLGQKNYLCAYTFTLIDFYLSFRTANELKVFCLHFFFHQKHTLRNIGSSSNYVNFWNCEYVYYQCSVKIAQQLHF